MKMLRRPATLENVIGHSKRRDRYVVGTRPFNVTIKQNWIEFKNSVRLILCVHFYFHSWINRR